MVKGEAVRRMLEGSAFSAMARDGNGRGRYLVDMKVTAGFSVQRNGSGW